MAIRVAVDVSPLAGRTTGIGEFVRAIAENIVGRKELDPTAYALTLRGFADLDSKLPVGLRRQRLPMPASALLRAWERFDRPALESWTGRVDVVHGTNFVGPPTKRAAELITVHDMTAVRFPEMCSATSLRYPALVARAIARGAHVHTPTQAVADEVVAHFAVAPERVHAIHHGVDALTTAPGSEPSVGRALAGADNYVVAVGTIEPRKTYDSLVRAFDQVANENSDVNLVIAGAPGWSTTAFDQTLAASPHKSRIIQLGWVSDVQRAALIRGASVLAFASVYEGFGLPPLEAMQCGTPVVATASGAVAEVVGGAGILVPVGDEDSLAAGIVTVLNDSQTGSDLVSAGHQRVQQFEWKRCVDELEALYKVLAVDRGGRR